MQDPAEEKQKKAAEARWHDTPKPVVRKCWKEDEGGKERYLQVILTEWISKQYLQVHVGD